MNSSAGVKLLVQGGGRSVCRPNWRRSEGEGASTRTHAGKHTQTASWDFSVGWARAWARAGWGAVGNVRTGEPRGCWETTEWAWSPWQRNWPKQFEATGNQVTGNEQ